MLAIASLFLALLCGASVSQFVRGSVAPDWYTGLLGTITLLAFTMHGALWIAMRATKSNSAVRERAARLAHTIWWAVTAVTVAGSAATLAIQPSVVERFAGAPWGYAFPVIAMAGLLGVNVCKAPQAEGLAYFSSCGFLAGLLAMVVFCAGSLPVLHMHAGGAVWLPGFALAAMWAVSRYRKVATGSEA